MRKVFLVAIIVVSACCGYAQQVETSRFEVSRWSKKQGCHFEPFAEKGGMMVYETDKTDEKKNRIWNFVTLDTSLVEQHIQPIPLPDKLKFFDSKSSSEWAAFVFLDEKAARSDSIRYFVVTCHLPDTSFNTFSDKLPELALLQSIALIDDNLTLSVNYRTGSGFLLQYDLSRNSHRHIPPHISNDFIIFQFTALPEERVFVLAAREYVEKHYKATTFQVYSKDGYLLHSHRFENPENSVLGRMCFAFDDHHQLLVYATLERESNKKVTVQGMTEDFSKIVVGVVWIKFASSGTLTRSFLFKDLPEIDQALTASDRLRVKEELLKMQKGKKQEKGEITFQFHMPRLVKFGDLQVFAAEAFQPVFHTETRMEHTYYGTYPVYYTVFDGYDFFSEILLAFDQDGMLRWYNSLRFENDLTEKLYAHATEAVCHDELLVASPSHNTLRYEVFDADGSRLLDQQVAPLDFLDGMDSFDDEYEAGIYQWYDDRFLIHGCQIVQNPRLRTPRRTVFYVQKIQYE
ncbi:MAG: hypothetical protein J6P73_02900 [Bacteroidales bacterium]|nr:hypothetical protein [Bacteroidales bacterium]